MIAKQAGRLVDRALTLLAKCAPAAAPAIPVPRVPDAYPGFRGSLLRDRTAGAAAWQCAMVAAQFAEWHLQTLAEMEGRMRQRRALQRQREICRQAVWHCFDLNVAPRGLGGCDLPLLERAMVELETSGEQP